MTYLTKKITGGHEFGLTNGEVVIPVSSIGLVPDEEIVRAIHDLAADYDLLSDYLGSGEFGLMTVEEAKSLVAKKKQQVRTLHVKQALTKERRTEFNSKRTHLLLALIERDGYLCQISGCGAQEELTIDHIVALSHGGTDELENLRLVCRSHNSEKGDRDAQQGAPGSTPQSGAP